VNSALRKGVLLLAHGSRDPLWRRPMEAVAQRLRASHPGVPVCCAYLELEQPDLAAGAEQLVAEGIEELTIVPMFLGTGKHARDDLPLMVAALRPRHPTVRIELRPPIGEDARVLDLLAVIAGE
jgi:sirohydrochlorin cobaltochelatase